MQVKSFVFEVTQKCNLQCLHCYNAWKSCPDYPGGELPTGETLAFLGKMLDETGAELVTLSGGEPLLRPDILDIINFLQGRGKKMNLISNGLLLSSELIQRMLPRKIGLFELPLLSSEREIHDRLAGVHGAFDRTTEAIAELKLAGQLVVTVFVATRLNLPTWRETIELALALGVDGLMFNRFNPGGEGARNIVLLQAAPKELQEALDIAEEMSETYKISVSCSIAMPPCLFETKKYKHLGFGFCAAGTDRAYYALDPMGFVRPCNHSPTILGNIRDTAFSEMVRSDALKGFMAAVPAFCEDCALVKTCQGGCKAAAESCFHDFRAADPFLEAFKSRAKKIRA